MHIYIYIYIYIQIGLSGLYLYYLINLLSIKLYVKNKTIGFTVGFILNNTCVVPHLGYTLYLWSMSFTKFFLCINGSNFYQPFCLNVYFHRLKLISRTPYDQRQGKYPVSLTAVLWLYMWTMLALFGNFYIKSYKPKTQENKAKLA
jgi:hypothetical protein